MPDEASEPAPLRAPAQHRGLTGKIATTQMAARVIKSRETQPPLRNLAHTQGVSRSLSTVLRLGVALASRLIRPFQQGSFRLAA
jgi:hypothetical protein